MTKDYFSVEILSNSEVRQIVWWTNDSQGVLIEDNGTVRSFPDGNALRLFASQIGIEVSADSTPVFDLDVIRRWTANPVADDLDVSNFLDTWNLFTDVATSSNRRFEPEGVDALYDKLFRSNNLPSITQPGGEFFPEWSREELTLLSTVLKEGLKLIDETVYA